MFEASVDGLGGSVAGAGPVEVGQHVGGALLQGPSEPAQLAQGCGDAVADRLDQRAHQFPASGLVGFAVGGDHPLVGAPGRFDLDVRVDLEQGLQTLVLLVGEQVGATALCNDGTSSYPAHRQGCSHHGGVQAFYN